MTDIEQVFKICGQHCEMAECLFKTFKQFKNAYLDDKQQGLKKLMVEVSFLKNWKDWKDNIHSKINTKENTL